MEITLQMKKLNKVTIERRKIEFNEEKHFDYSKYHIRYTKKNHSHPKEVVSISNINIIRCIVVLNENEFVVSISNNQSQHQLQLYEYNRERKIFEFKTIIAYHKLAIICVIHSTINCFNIISSSFDKTIQINQINKKDNALILRGHKTAVLSLFEIKPKKLLLSSSFDRTLIIWNMTTYANEQTIKGENVIYKFDFFPLIDNSIICGCKEKIIGLTISNEMKIETKEILSATSIISFALCKINTIVYSKGENSIIVYDMKEEKEVEQITFNDKIKMIIKDDEYIISFGEEKNIYIINEENYALVTKVYLNSIFSFNSVSLYNHSIYYNEDKRILQI